MNASREEERLLGARVFRWMGNVETRFSPSRLQILAEFLKCQVSTGYAVLILCVYSCR